MLRTFVFQLDIGKPGCRRQRQRHFEIRPKRFPVRRTDQTPEVQSNHFPDQSLCADLAAE